VVGAVRNQVSAVLVLLAIMLVAAMLLAPVRVKRPAVALTTTPRPSATPGVTTTPYPSRLYLPVVCSDFATKERRWDMDQQGWTAILGLIAPLVIAVLKQSGFTKAQNSLIALGVCLAVGIADAWYFGTMDPMDVTKTVFTVVSTAFVSYKMFFQALGIDDWLTEATSVKK